MDDLKSDIRGELDQLHLVVRELESLQRDLGGRPPSIREKVAAAGFLSQFYSGIENILKRISTYADVPLPEGEGWHVELFEGFAGGAGTSPVRQLPLLFNEDLASDVAKYRGFRHVARMAYGLELKWELMREGIERVEEVFEAFKAAVLGYLEQSEERD